jgi:hypothetical protein
MRHENFNGEQDSPFLYQVVWVEPEKGFWAVGLEALEPGNPWRMTFPETLVARRRI